MIIDVRSHIEYDVIDPVDDALNISVSEIVFQKSTMWDAPNSTSD